MIAITCINNDTQYGYGLNIGRLLSIGLFTESTPLRVHFIVTLFSRGIHLVLQLGRTKEDELQD